MTRRVPRLMPWRPRWAAWPAACAVCCGAAWAFALWVAAWRVSRGLPAWG